VSTTENEGFPAQPGEAPLEETVDVETTEVIDETQAEPIAEDSEVDDEPLEESEDDGPKLITPKGKAKG